MKQNALFLILPSAAVFLVASCETRDTTTETPEKEVIIVPEKETVVVPVPVPAESDTQPTE